MSERKENLILEVAVPAFVCGTVAGWLLSRSYRRNQPQPPPMVSANSPVKSTGGSLKISANQDWQNIGTSRWTANVGSIASVSIVNVRSACSVPCYLTLGSGWKIKIQVSDKCGCPISGEEVWLQDTGKSGVGLELKGKGSFLPSRENEWRHCAYHVDPAHPADNKGKEHMGNILVYRSASESNPVTYDSLRDEPNCTTEISLWTK